MMKYNASHVSPGHIKNSGVLYTFIQLHFCLFLSVLLLLFYCFFVVISVEFVSYLFLA